jgi:hypothetical protein
MAMDDKHTAKIHLKGKLIMENKKVIRVKKELVKRQIAGTISYGFDNVVVVWNNKAYRGAQILRLMVDNNYELPIPAVLKVSGANCIGHPDSVIDRQQLFINAIALKPTLVDFYVLNSKGQLNVVKLYELRMQAQFNTRSDWMSGVPLEDFEEYLVCFLKIYNHLVEKEVLVEMYNPEDNKHRIQVKVRTHMQAIAGKRSAQALQLAKSFEVVTKEGAIPVEQLRVQPVPFNIVSPGEYQEATGHGITTWGKKDTLRKAMFVEKGKAILWDLSKSEKRYTVGHSSGTIVPAFSTDYILPSIEEYGRVFGGVKEVKHEVVDYKDLGKVDVYEIVLTKPFLYKAPGKKSKTVEFTSFKIAAMKGDAYSYPSMLGTQVTDVSFKRDENAEEQKEDSELLSIDVTDEVEAAHQANAKEVIAYMNKQKESKALPTAQEFGDLKEKIENGNNVTDGSGYFNHAFGTLLEAHGVLDTAVQGFQFRINPAQKGFMGRHDEFVAALGVDIVLFASATKAAVHHEWFTKQTFRFAVLNKTNHAPDSFKALPSSVVQNLMLDMKEGKEILDELREKAFAHAKKSFSDQQAASLDATEEEAEVDETLFGSAKTRKAQPLLIHDRYHREGIAKELRKSLRKQNEGYVFLEGTRTLYLMCDPIAVLNALQDGNVVLDDKGFMAAIIIEEKHCEIGKGKVVVANLEKGKLGTAMEGEALVNRAPQQDEAEVLLVEMTATPKYKNALKSGHFMGMILLSAMDWSAAQISGADFDGDFAFLVLVKLIVDYFKKYVKKHNVKPKLNKWVRIENGHIELGDGCPFKGIKNVTEADRYARHSDWITKDLGLQEYAGKFEVYEDRKKGTFHAEFHVDMPARVCNEIVAHFNPKIIQRSLTLNDIGILANRLMLMQELKAYYTTLLEEIKETKSLDAIKTLITKDYVGDTVPKAVAYFNGAIKQIDKLKNTTQIAAWYEIDAPKHGGAYKPFVQVIDTTFKAVDVYKLNREDRILKVVLEKGVFAPLFFHQYCFNGKVRKLNPVKPKWLANQKYESRYTDFTYVKDGETRKATPISLYAEESKVIYRQGEDVLFKDELASSTPLIPVFEELFGKAELAKYKLHAVQLMMQIGQVSNQKQNYFNKLLADVNAKLSKQDLLTDHMKDYSDIKKAMVKKHMPNEYLKLNKGYARKVQEILTQVGGDAAAKIENFNGSILFAAYLKEVSKGKNSNPAVAWNILEKYALDLIQTDAFTKAYNKAILLGAPAVKEEVIKPAVEEVPAPPAPETKRTIPTLGASIHLNHEVTHEAPAPQVEAPKQGRGIPQINKTVQLNHEVQH